MSSSPADRDWAEWSIASKEKELKASAEAVAEILRSKVKALNERTEALALYRKQTVAANGHKSVQVGADGRSSIGSPGRALIDLNIGGQIGTYRLSALTQDAQSMLARILSGRWDKRLPRDEQGHIFFDLDIAWVTPIFNRLKIKEGGEELTTAEEQLPENSDDLVGYYAAIDFFGLRPLLEAPLGGLIKEPDTFARELQLSDPGWSKPWKLLYRASRDGFDQGSYQARVSGYASTVTTFLDETGAVFGAYTGLKRQFTDKSTPARLQDPASFAFFSSSRTAGFVKSVPKTAAHRAWKNGIAGCSFGKGDILYPFGPERQGVER